MPFLIEIVPNNKRVLLFNARETITQGLIQGQSVAKMSKSLADAMGKSYHQAETLIRTETNNFHSQADVRAYEAAGVEEYEFVATLDSRTSEICASLDGKHFPIKEAKTGVNYPPMHPRCRSTTVEYDPEDAADWAASGQPMPENMTYEEWFDSDVLARSISRKEANTGAFSNLKIPMQKRYVRRIAEQYNIDLSGITIKIQRSESMLSLTMTGSTDYNNIGRIDLFPNAFIDEEQLVKTLLHEKRHVWQLKTYGKKYVEENLNSMEEDAYSFEDEQYNLLKKRAKK